MDVVYPLTNQSVNHDDFELRYSLRSLENQDWVDNVFLIGHNPSWVKNVIHIPCNDPYSNCKDANIINKILRACFVLGLSNEFVVNSDDQYFMRKVSEDELMPMLERPGMIPEIKRKASVNNWHKRTMDSVYWCKVNKVPDWIFQSHCPYKVNKSKYGHSMLQIPWGKGNGFVTHIYFNLTLPEAPIVEPVGRTVRIKSPLVSGILRKTVQGSTFLNHNNNGLNSHLKSFIMERFPNASRWE